VRHVGQYTGARINLGTFSVSARSTPHQAAP
jgi:hypothetical protein